MPCDIDGGPGDRGLPALPAPTHLNGGSDAVVLLAFANGKHYVRWVTPHILFVDDEAPIRELLSLYFRKKNWEVTTATTVEEAKQTAAKVPFNLAIVDLNLAGENGLALLGFFKKNYPQAPVIVFTGQTAEELLEEALAAGADGVMLKTEPLSALYNLVRGYLPQS